MPDLPDSRTPMFIMYKKGEILNQVVVAWGADRERRIEGKIVSESLPSSHGDNNASPELEALFVTTGVISMPERRRPDDVRRRGYDDNSDDDSDDDPSSRMRSAATTTNGRRSKTIRTGNNKDNDGDSDFEFDL